MSRGDLLNINADYLARAVAISLGAKKLILMTDVRVFREWTGFGSSESCGRSGKIDSGDYWGMILKFKSAVQTVESGVEQVIIGDNLTDGTIIKE